MEGVCRNILVTGLITGGIKIFDANDLLLLRVLDGGHKSPVTAVALNSDHTQLISGDESGLLVCWSCKKPLTVMPMGI